MSFKKKAKYDWRSFLTKEEEETIRLADEARSKWQCLNRERASITNRAIHRAKYASEKAERQ